MRYTLVIMILAVCSLSLYAQDNDAYRSVRPGGEMKCSQFAPTSDNGFDYKKTKEWRRYKVLRAVGWSAFGLGVPATLFGVSMVGYEHGISGGDAPLGAAIIAVGGSLVVASIPLLICAYRYRNKAKNMNVALSAINTPKVASAGMGCVPALSFSLTF